MGTLNGEIAAVYGRRWRLHLLWYLEGATAFAACWAYFTHGSPRAAFTVLAYLALCGAALALPGHALRLSLRRLGAAPAARRVALQLLFAFAAAAIIAALSTGRSRAAIVCILLLGSTLWGLELEQRSEASAKRHGT
ncbi:MAG: hypothetical protein WC709_08555 [Thermoleophilia bacterium]